MREKPIIFTDVMVQALIAGTKTQTRRLSGLGSVNNRADDVKSVDVHHGPDTTTVLFDFANCEHVAVCPYGTIGTKLWVRENFYIDGYGSVIYQANGPRPDIAGLRWKPSIHMRREYSSLSMEITDIRVERIASISSKDARAEGIECIESGANLLFRDYTREKETYEWITPVSSFRSLWKRIHGEPAPVMQKGRVVGYIQMPFTANAFDGYRRPFKHYRGKPLQVIPNPWVWVIEWKTVEHVQPR